MKKQLILIGVIVIIAAGAYALYSQNKQTVSGLTVTDFESCVAAGNAVMESYPEQCRTKDGQNFTRDVGNELEKTDLIKINTPRPGVTITSPLSITGEARGNWYFEASFPVELQDANGKVLVQHYAQAQGEWMTEDFVPFESIIEFAKPETATGKLILRKDNPSGLPEHDDALIVPVKF